MYFFNIAIFGIKVYLSWSEKTHISMKFPSLKTLSESFVNTIKRFPFETLFAITGTIAGIIDTDWINKTHIEDNWCIRVMLISNLGLLLSLAVNLYTAGKALKPAHKIIFKLTAALFAAWMIFLLNPMETSADYFRFFLISLGFHLLVSFAAFTDNAHIQGFWQFNKTIFLRFLASVLYSGVLYLGLAGAIGAASFLFNLKIDGVRIWFYGIA